MIKLLSSNNPALVRISLWALVALSRGQLAKIGEMTTYGILPLVIKYIISPLPPYQVDILVQALWLLVNILTGSGARILPQISELGLLNHIGSILLVPNLQSEILLPLIKVLNFVASAEDSFMFTVLSHEPRINVALLELMQQHRSSPMMLRELIYLLSNIAAGARSVSSHLVKTPHLVEFLISLMTESSSPFELKKEVINFRF